eukprot:365072-Chlamydomonas_euryale.AAC.19
MECGRTRVRADVTNNVGETVEWTFVMVLRTFSNGGVAPAGSGRGNGLPFPISSSERLKRTFGRTQRTVVSTLPGRGSGLRDKRAWLLTYKHHAQIIATLHSCMMCACSLVRMRLSHAACATCGVGPHAVQCSTSRTWRSLTDGSACADAGCLRGALVVRCLFRVTTYEQLIDNTSMQSSNCGAACTPACARLRLSGARERTECKCDGQRLDWARTGERPCRITYETAHKKDK